MATMWTFTVQPKAKAASLILVYLLVFWVNSVSEQKQHISDHYIKAKAPWRPSVLCLCVMQ